MVGETVGSYRIERELGTGGMGAVYVARHALLDKLAAVKMLRPKWSAEKEAIDRFFTEAKATTAVRHPGIVDVYDFGFHESGSAFLVMELLDGESLGDALREGGPIPGGLAAAIGYQVAGALAAAHEREIIHRDLKPDNIFLIEDSTAAFGVRAKILDFGIAKLTRPGSVEHTSPGEIIGTPLYMSPEQCRGQTLSGQSDVYSLGCLLYHAVAGEPPFSADDTVVLLRAHALETPPRLSEIAPSTLPELDELIALCMAKHPGERPSCADLANRLRQIAEEVDTVGTLPREARTPTVDPSGDPPPTRRRAWPWAVAAAAVTIVAVVFIAGGGPLTIERPPPIETALPAVVPIDAPPPQQPVAEPVADPPPAIDASVASSERPRPVKKPAKKKVEKKKWGELLPRSPSSR